MTGTFWSDLIIALIQHNAAFFLASLEANNSNTENCHNSLICPILMVWGYYDVMNIYCY